jgi:cystathionine beta-lyase/cystathionine gamma-synthase
MSKLQSAGFSTRAVHDGQEPEALTGSVGVPIYATSTYVQDGLGAPRLGYEYARVSNPTRDRLETNLASLEGGVGARVFASGMAAVTALCQTMKAGEHLVCVDNAYGGVPRLFDQLMTHFDLKVSYVDMRDPKNVACAIRPNTRYVYCETPTNPLMQLLDIEAVSKIAHERGVQVVVDNTFMSPYFQRPLELGADLVLHSTTKFLNGHSDGLGGVLVCSTQEQFEQYGFIQKAAGAILSPFEAWLVLRGVKTLAVRMRQHDQNGRIIADFLAHHPKVHQVFYPGLKSHPQYELACRQMTGFGSMITFETGSLENAKTLVAAVEVCTLGESLGGVETLISHPASMTHSALGEEGRRKIGLTDGMVRISVGIEDVEDILRDLEHALDSIA